MEGAGAEEGGPGRGDLAERTFVGAVGAALVLVLSAFVARYGSDIPLWDDFEMVPVIAGERPFSLAWLWEPVSGHRAPVRKLVFLAIDSVTGRGFRVMPFLNVLSLAAAALLCVAAARRLRGRTSYLDAAFPLLLLDPGWGPSILRVTLFTAFLRTALLSGVIFHACGIRGNAPARGLRGVALCASGLALCLTPGLVAAIPILIWVAWRAGSEGRAVRWIAAATGLFAVAYLVGIGSGGAPPAARPVVDGARVALQALGQGFGPAGAFGWRQVRFESFGAAFPPLLSLAALVLATLPALGAILRGADGDRSRREGLAAVCASVLAVAAVTGLGRAGLGSDHGLQNHYGATAAPALAAGLLLLPLALPGPRSEFLLHGAFALLAALLTFNLQVGYRQCRDEAAAMAALEAAARAGAGSAALSRREGRHLGMYEYRIEHDLELLRRAGRPPFAR